MAWDKIGTLFQDEDGNITLSGTSIRLSAGEVQFIVNSGGVYSDYIPTYSAVSTAIANAIADIPPPLNANIVVLDPLADLPNPNSLESNTLVVRLKAQA